MAISNPMGSVPGKKGGPGTYNGIDGPGQLSKKGDSGPDTIPVKTMEDIPIKSAEIETPFSKSLKTPKR